MTHSFGQKGEQFVVDYLKQNQFKILEKNYRQFFGEIDIIARKNAVIAFIEVKSRKNTQISMFELVPYSKQQKIIKTAQQYIATHYANSKDIIFRFDVALVHYATEKQPEISYIQNAF